MEVVKDWTTRLIGKFRQYGSRAVIQCGVAHTMQCALNSLYIVFRDPVLYKMILYGVVQRGF